MKILKKDMKTFVRTQLESNPAWALKALVRIYTENQTDSEKNTQSASFDNGIGFSGTDAEILSSFAEQYQNRNSLSPKQMAIVMKKMPKYWKQVIQMSEVEKLNKAFLSSKGA